MVYGYDYKDSRGTLHKCPKRLVYDVMDDVNPEALAECGFQQRSKRSPRRGPFFMVRT